MVAALRDRLNKYTKSEILDYFEYMASSTASLWFIDAEYIILNQKIRTNLDKQRKILDKELN